MPELKKRLPVLMIFILSALPARPAVSNTPRLFSPEEVREDVQFLWRTIKDVHPCYDHRTAKDILEQCYRDALSQITRPLDPGAVYLLCCPLVSLISDAHTSMEFQVPSRGISYLPIDVLFVEGRAYLKRSYAPDFKEKPDSQIVSVNSRPIGEIVRRLLAMLPGECESMKWRSLETDLFKVYHHLLFPEEKRFRIRFRSADGGESEPAVAGVERDVISAARKSRGPAGGPLDFKVDNLHQTALMTVKTFANADLSKFLAASFKRLREAGCRNLVIDLRDNLGGDTEQAEELISYLSDAPAPLIPRLGIRASPAFKKHMKEKIPKLLRWLSLHRLSSIGTRIERSSGGIVTADDDDPLPKKPENLRFKGKVFLLINGHTLSSASLLAHELQERTSAAVCGQESGYSAAGSFFEPLSFRLPHSGLSFTVSSMVLLDPAGLFRKCSAGVRPDIPIVPSPAAESEGRDSILDQAWHFVLSDSQL